MPENKFNSSDQKQQPPPARAWVYFDRAYGDFLQFKRGDLCREPTPEMLEMAKATGRMSIIQPADQPAFLKAHPQFS